MSKSSKARQAQSQHASAAAHCTNHYTRSVLQLERTLEERLTELSLLSQENSALKRREAALQSAVSSLAGSVSAATKAVLVSSAAEAADALRATLRPASPEVCCAIADHKGFLLRMQQREAAVQNIMGQLGCVNPDELYSSWLLRRAFANPDRAFSHLARSKAERVAYVLATVQKLGLLLGKYDLLHHPTTAMGTPREQLDNLIDDLNERTLAFCLLAPPQRQLEMACLNMETGLPEPYPTGWWAVVIDAMHLTDDQKAALKICWDKVKPIKLALTAKYEALSAQLAQLQRKQLDQQRQFEIQAEHAIDAAISRKAARQQMDQQQQQQQHQQQQLLIAQQQQQQWLLQQQQQTMFAQQQQNGQLMQQAQQLNPAHAWEQQQQQHVMQQQPQEQLQRKSSILDAVMHEQELFQFCRVLLGSELEGLEGGMSDQLLPKDPFALAATATSAHMPAAAAAAPNQALGMYPGVPAAAGVLKHEPACCMPVAVNGAAGLPAAAVAGMQQQQQQQMAMGMQQQAAGMQQQQQHQQQGYAARHAPIQLQQDQKQFMQFSPALAAAAAASDQHLWLQGFSPDMVVSSPSQSPHGLMVVQQSDSGSQGTASGGQQGDVDDDAGMVVDAPQQQQQRQQAQMQMQPSTSSTGADLASKSVDTSSGQSKQSETPSNSTPSALETAAAAMPAAAAIVAGHKQRISGTGDVWQELAGVLPSTQQGAAQNGGSGQGQVMSDKEQRKLERQLDKITAQLKMQQYCMHTYVLNICSKKQMALKYVNCYPWVPESFSMCEALDELGW